MAEMSFVQVLRQDATAEFWGVLVEKRDLALALSEVLSFVIDAYENPEDDSTPSDSGDA